MLHQIGVGALGPVFRTYEPTRDRLVAVKVFRLDVTPEQARALADELGRAANAGLFHPSIVEPVAAGIEGTVAYRAEEYVAAESLDVAMRHYAPASADKALPFITQLASALDFARAAGVGHGALHPRDIFVTPDEARATGFGVVDALDRLGLRAPVRRPYSPPERIAGQPWGTAADVFSLGVIAFELLTGRRPSGLGDDMGPLTGATLGDRAAAVRAVLARAMDANPTVRFGTACAFSAALAEAAGLAETTVSLAALSMENPRTPSAETKPVVRPSGSAGATTDAPLSVPIPTSEAPSVAMIAEAGAPSDLPPEAAEPEPGQSLDDFDTEVETPSPHDSPREVARKVIAAREVRKRQVKKKPVDDDSEKGATVPLPIDLTKSGAKARPEEARTALSSAPELPAADTVLVSAQPPPVEATPDAPDEVPILEPASVPADDMVEVPLLQAADLEHVRDLSDRVIAVDEFRAREAANSKADRGWPRSSERPGSERSVLDRTVLDRPDRSVLIQPDTVESIGSEVHPPMFETPVSDRQRLVILPYALVLGLGLVLGYAPGYVVGYREGSSVAAATTQGRPTATEAQAPTTGTAVKEATEQVVPPNAPGVPSDSTPNVATPPAVNPSGTPTPAPRPEKAVAAAGRLVVTSSPAKAAVTINGKWSGRTPLTLTDLKFGKYVVRIVQPGYEVVREQFALSPTAASRTVDVTLRRSKAQNPAPAPEARAPQVKSSGPAAKPAATTGELYVDSRPRGARVFVDGKEQGVTPLQLTAQPPGPRSIRLELVDHRSWTNTTKVVAGEVARVTGSLERIK